MKKKARAFGLLSEPSGPCCRRRICPTMQNKNPRRQRGDIQNEINDLFSVPFRSTYYGKCFFVGSFENRAAVALALSTHIRCCASLAISAPG